MAETNGNGHGSKVWTPVLSILALVAGVSAVITPMYAGLINEEKLREKAEARIKELEDEAADVQAQLAAMQVQFAEVETQFRGAKDQLDSVDGRIELRLNSLDKLLQQEIKNVADIGAIMNTTQKDNVRQIQDLQVRQTAVETYIKFGRNPLAKLPGQE